MGYKAYAGGIGSVGRSIGSYHESYARLRAPGDPRKELDESEGTDPRSRASRASAAAR